MTAMRFVWIDDHPSRIDKWKPVFEAGPEHKEMSAQIEAFPIQEDLLPALQSWVIENADHPPSLFIVDHNLQQAVKRGGLNLKGSSLAHLLRLNFPRIPIVCVTGQEINSNSFDWEDLSEYTQVFPFAELNIAKHLELIFAIASDYKKICLEHSRHVRRDIVEVLSPPEPDKESLFAILPEEFESNVVHETTPHRIARWILNVFMERPGYLLDGLGAATFVGLTQQSFERIATERFPSAAYKGPFATSARTLWWASALSADLYSNLPAAADLPPQLAGRRLPGVKAEDFSICTFTGRSDPPPDAVAYLDDQLRDRAPMSAEYTEPVGPDTALGFAPRLRMRRGPR
jgi:hypothetical protein